MNKFVNTFTVAVLLHLSSAQDYATPTYNPDAVNPTNDYLNTNDPRYDNPYDPSRRFPNRNQYDSNRNPYNPDQRYNQYDNRNDPSYLNPYSPDNTPRPPWDASRTYTSFKSAELEHDSVILNEA